MKSASEASTDSKSTTRSARLTIALPLVDSRSVDPRSAPPRRLDIRLSDRQSSSPTLLTAATTSRQNSRPSRNGTMPVVWTR
ncbi:Uncharacterised protein [Mycobacteroides abscessus subsp. abscessus]|nr:Uncharacterised protein [Mycobacteroides abscessus subsp. abscessus]